MKFRAKPTLSLPSCATPLPLLFSYPQHPLLQHPLLTPSPPPFSPTTPLSLPLPHHPSPSPSPPPFSLPSLTIPLSLPIPHHPSPFLATPPLSPYSSLPPHTLPIWMQSPSSCTCLGEVLYKVRQTPFLPCCIAFDDTDKCNIINSRLRQVQ